MATKKTIAIIASTNEKAAAIADKLSLENSRLLVVSKYPNEFIELATDIKSRQPNVELDLIDCMKDGCWEADIIILDIPFDEETAVAALIKEVSTQKIVVSFSEDENGELQNVLKYSKVVSAIKTTGSSCISFYGKDQDAVLEVADILKNSEQKQSNDLTKQLLNNKKYNN